MDAFNTYKSSLLNAVSKELNSFNNKLKEELALRDHAFDAERQGLREEVHILQQEALRIKELEADNTNLRLELKSIQQSFPDISSTELKPNTTGSSIHQTQSQNSTHETPATPSNQATHSNIPGADQNELAQLRRKLANITSDYRKAIVANGIIQGKYRQLRQRYMKDIPIPQKKVTAIQNDGSGDQLDLDRETTNGACTPTLSSPKYLLNNTQKSISPLDIPLDDIQTLATHRDTSWDRRPYGKSSIEIEAATTQIIPDRSQSVEQESAAETSDESPKQLGLATPIYNAHGKPVTEDGKSLVKPEDEDSDFLVVVSERSLKRKRAPSTKQITLGEIRKTGLSQGSIIKPIHIKCDPGSSSPLNANAHHGIVNLHDSLDLDEIEDRHMTPRKRRGFFKKIKPNSSGDVLPAVLGHDITLFDRWSDNGDAESFNHQASPWHENLEEIPTIRDEAFYKERGEEYAAKLMEEEIRNAFRLRARIESNKALPLWLQRSKYAKVARQYSYNQKTHERNERLTGTPNGTSKSEPKNSYGPSSEENVKMQTRGKEKGSVNSIPSDDFYEARSPSQLKGRFSKAICSTPSALEPTDPNILILPRTSGLSANETRWQSRRPGDRSATKLSLLAEDGETSNAAINPKMGNGTSNSGRSGTIVGNSRPPDIFNRLGSLLSEQPSPTTPLVLAKPGAKLMKSAAAIQTLPNTPSPPINSKVLPTLLPRFSKRSKFSGGYDKSSVQKPRKWKPLPSELTNTNEPEQVLSEHEPFRTRPIGSLRPEDFKLNPSRNQGFDHAFVDVIRNRDQRKCLPGCTRSGCCGSALRRAVEIGGYGTPQKSRLSNPASKDDAQEEDRRLLEEYLGDDSARLEGIPDDERRELLLKAKTEKFANQHGKHRHVYKRGSTPPGFWDADMPTTQQAQEYRKAAVAMEQDKVQDMYREAMRPNGRYKFRDE